MLTDREAEQEEAGNEGKSKKILEGITSDSKNECEGKWLKMKEVGCIMCVIVQQCIYSTAESQM